MGTTLSTPSVVSSACRAPSRFSPMAATTVSSVPSITWLRRPSCSICSMTWSIWARLAPGFMTTIMGCLLGSGTARDGRGSYQTNRASNERNNRREKERPAGGDRKNKEGSGEIDAGAPYQIEKAATDGSPSAAFRAASTHYDYTSD